MRSHKSLRANTKVRLFFFSPSCKRQHPLKAVRSKPAEQKQKCRSTKAQEGDQFHIQKARALKVVPKLISAMPVSSWSHGWVVPSSCWRSELAGHPKGRAAAPGLRTSGSHLQPPAPALPGSLESSCHRFDNGGQQPARESWLWLLRGC